MKQKIIVGLTALTAFAASAAASMAQVFTTPTSTASQFTANVGTQLADPGTLTIIVVAISIPLFFYVVHALMGLLPGRRARKN